MTDKQPEVEVDPDSVDADQHPDTGMWRFIWVSPGGAEHIGLFHHNSEGKAKVAGKQFAQRQLTEAAKLSPRGQHG